MPSLKHRMTKPICNQGTSYVGAIFAVLGFSGIGIYLATLPHFVPEHRVGFINQSWPAHAWIPLPWNISCTASGWCLQVNLLSSNWSCLASIAACPSRSHCPSWRLTQIVSLDSHSCTLIDPVDTAVLGLVLSVLALFMGTICFVGGRRKCV